MTKLSRLLARDLLGMARDTETPSTSDTDTWLQPSIRASFGSGTSEEDVAMMLEVRFLSMMPANSFVTPLVRILRWATK